jgi:hypothetical protein
MGAIRLHRRIGAAAALVALAAGLIAGTAGATVVERGRYSDTYSDTFSDCGFPIRLEGTASGQYRFREGKGKTETAFFLRDTFRFRDVYTNTDTGEWFVVTGHGVFNEVKATRVEGSVFEFVQIQAGQPFTVYDSNGELVLRDRGVIRFTILFDTRGDDEPGGDFVEEIDVRVNGPHPGFMTDFCEIATPLIGS